VVQNPSGGFIRGGSGSARYKYVAQFIGDKKSEVIIKKPAYSGLFNGS